MASRSFHSRDSKAAVSDSMMLEASCSPGGRDVAAASARLGDADDAEDERPDRGVVDRDEDDDDEDGERVDIHTPLRIGSPLEARSRRIAKWEGGTAHQDGQF